MGYSVEFRAEAVARVAAGRSGMAVARDMGVGHASVTRWATVAGMTLRMGRIGGVGLVVEPEIGVVDKAGHLTYYGRVAIWSMVKDGASQSAIAGAVGVHRSTILRELRRGAVDGKEYLPWVAETVHREAIKRPKPSKLAPGTLLREKVVELLDQKLSPEQISGRLRIDYPEREDMQVSHETIYQTIYIQGAGSLRQELKVEKALRSGRTGRRPASRLTARPRGRSWIGDDARISSRPAEANDRAIPGHWEGDLVIGTDGTSALVTLNERASRFTLISRLDTHDADTVAKRLVAMVARLPEAAFQTLTWDQGVEMARHNQFTIATGIKVYFCDPHSPWQRPTNENGNGLIRDFYPKSTNFSQVTDAEIAEMERLLNIRPRAILGFATPAEILQQTLGVALTA